MANEELFLVISNHARLSVVVASVAGAQAALFVCRQLFCVLDQLLSSNIESPQCI